MDSSDRAAARLEIHDACLRFARGVDRADRDLITSAFHPSAVIDYTVFKGDADQFADWVLPLLHQAYTSASHLNMNHLVEFSDDGTSAVGEMYVLAIFRFERDGETFDFEGMGRYFDEYGVQDGRWLLTSRRTISDWERTVHVSPERSELAKAVGSPGRRDQSDPSYAHFAKVRERQAGVPARTCYRGWARGRGSTRNRPASRPGRAGSPLRTARFSFRWRGESLSHRSQPATDRRSEVACRNNQRRVLNDRHLLMTDTCS